MAESNISQPFISRMGLIIFSMSLLLGVGEIHANAKNERKNIVNQEVIQLFLDNSKINSYFHADKLPERSPLIIVENGNINKDMALSKFGVAVVYMEKVSAIHSMKPYLEINEFRITRDSASLNFNYPPEGLAGEVKFSKKNGEWFLSREKIIEK